MNHVDLDDLADLVLDPAETPDSVRRHVESCPECTDRLHALLDVRRLAVGEPLVAPPDRVRDRVLAQVRGSQDADEPQTLQAADAPRDELRPRRRVPAWAAGLAAGVALAVGRARRRRPDTLGRQPGPRRARLTRRGGRSSTSRPGGTRNST